MPFQFALKINFVPEITRIIKEQLQILLNLPPPENREKAAMHTYVHEARKATKRLRAILQLLKPVLSRTDFNLALRTFEQIASMLADLRDANSRLLAIEHLMKSFRDREEYASIVAVRNYLANELRNIEEHDFENVFEQIQQHTSYVEYQVQTWSIDKPGRKLIFKSIRRIYKNARNISTKAFSSNKMELLHDFRKQNKFLLHHIELIKQIWPEVMEAYIGEFSKLSDLLGEEHDLELLHSYIDELTHINEMTDEAGIVLVIINNRRLYLQNSIFHLQSKIYVDKPNNFKKRLRKYWDNWQASEGYDFTEEND